MLFKRERERIKRTKQSKKESKKQNLVPILSPPLSGFYASGHALESEWLHPAVLSSVFPTDRKRERENENVLNP